MPSGTRLVFSSVTFSLFFFLFSLFSSLSPHHHLYKWLSSFRLISFYDSLFELFHFIHYFCSHPFIVAFSPCSDFLLFVFSPTSSLFFLQFLILSLFFSNFLLFLFFPSLCLLQSLQKESLKNVNIEVNPGELLVVIGSVGSGKTCLLYAILSEIERVSGSLSLNGVISYCPQESWCFGGSIRENILLGQKMDQKKYQSVIKACGLERDLSLFPCGDETFVGEKGYTLSGGQKARVTLARAVYREADIYLLDDPLSAVDPHVANHIFDKCINGYLKEKTVILITHQLQFMKESDKIAVMNDGFNLVTGSYKEILASGVDIVAFLEKRDEESKRQPSHHPGQRSREASMTVSISRSHHEEEELQTFCEDYCEVEGKGDREEMMALGSVGGRVYWEYFRSGASFFYLAAVIVVTSASQVAYNYNDYWLSLWTEKYKPDANGTFPTASIQAERDNVLIYSALMLALFSFYLGRVLLSFFMCLNCSIELHNRIFRSVVRAHMSFFETNPIGKNSNNFHHPSHSLITTLLHLMTHLFLIFFSTFFYRTNSQQIHQRCWYYRSVDSLHCHGLEHCE